MQKRLIKLVFIASVFLVCFTFVRGIPVMVKVHQYQSMLETDINKVKQDKEEFEEYVEKARELNQWRARYLGEIKDNPLFVFCADKIEEFKAIPMS